MTAEPPIAQVATKEVYRNRWMTVREDDVRFAGGNAGIYGVVEKPDFALIVPIHADGRLQLVRQYRYPVGGRYWEFPQGSWEDCPDADPIALARGELREETGFDAAILERIGHLFQAYGYCNQGFHMVLATGLTHVGTNRAPEEADMETAGFAVDAVIAMITDGEIKDAATIAALGMLRMQGRI